MPATKAETANDRASRIPLKLSTPVPQAALRQQRQATFGIAQRAAAGLANMTPSELLRLQRGLGNRAVNQLLSSGGPFPATNRQARPVLQAKLTIGAVDDPYEREADRVAGHVLSARAPQDIAGQREDEPVAPGRPPMAAITRLRGSATPPGSMREAGDRRSGFDAGREFEDRLASHEGGGRPLPDSVRSFMEPRFGADFSQVRVHAGRKPAELNRQLGAHAFAYGHHIYLSAGAAMDDQRLMAHELTHVVQQGAARPIQRLSEPRQTDGEWSNQLRIQRLAYQQAVDKYGLHQPRGYEQREEQGQVSKGEQADLLLAREVPEQPSLLDALRYAAQRFEEVGEPAAEIRALNKNMVNNTFGQRRHPKQMEQFIYYIVVPYPVNDERYSLSLTYEYTNKTPGYIIEQETYQEGVSKIAQQRPPNDQVGFAASYASQHDTLGGAEPLQNFILQQPHLPMLENARRLDNRTKLAGEGARFNLIKSNMHRIADATRIFTRTATHVHWIRFPALFRSWRDVFASRFGIPDAQVARALVAPDAQPNWSETPTTVPGADFVPQPHDIEV